MKNDKEKRLIRLLKIILTLDQGTIRLENVAKEENCSLRTIQRDIAALDRAGLPIVRNYNNTWAFMEDFNLRKITATNAIDYSFLTEILNYINTNKIGQKSEFADKNKSISALYAALANKLYKENDYQAALNLYKRAFSFNKQDADIKLFIIKNYIKLKEYKKALKMMQEPSETAEISREKVLCYLQLGQDKKALDEMDTFLNLRLSKIKISNFHKYNIISLLYQMGKYDKALDMLKKYIFFNQHRKSTYYFFHLYLRLHNLEETKKHFIAYNKILLNEINAKDIYYQYVLKRDLTLHLKNAKDICIRLNDKESAIKYCKLIYEREIKSPYGLAGRILEIYDISHLYLPANAKKELYNVCNKEIEKCPSYRNYFARALVYYMFKDIKNAQADFNKALEGILKEQEEFVKNNEPFLKSYYPHFDTFYPYLKPIIKPSVINKYNNQIKKLKLKFAENMLKNYAGNKESIRYAGSAFSRYGKYKEAIICYKHGLDYNMYADITTLEILCDIYKRQKDETNYKKYSALLLKALNKLIYEDYFISRTLWKKAEFLYDRSDYKTAFLYFQKGFQFSFFHSIEIKMDISKIKDKFIDCCRKLKEKEAEKEFLYLCQTAGKYPMNPDID